MIAVRPTVERVYKAMGLFFAKGVPTQFGKIFRNWKEGLYLKNGPITLRGGSSIFWKWGPNKNTNQRALARLGSALGAPF